MERALDPKRYYRLPWTLTDNVLGWLEPTKRCNIACVGCYSKNDPKSDKSLAQVRADLDVFTSRRRMDSISIAGGDPLIHPEIVDIVRMIRHDYGLKPVINTNGVALTEDLLVALKDAGLHGFTFHVDSSQGRPHWKKKTEVELCEVRLRFAEMVARVGGLSVAFNATIFPHTLDQVPALVRWAGEHIDIVHSMVFILFRTSRASEFDYFAQGKPVEVEDLVYLGQEKNPEPLKAQQVVDKIREADPDYEPSAYLGGTVDPESFKWLLAGRLGDGERTYGYVGPKYMELVQGAHHLATGRYLAYSKPEMLSHGRSMLLGFSAVDGPTRKALGRWSFAVAKRPWRAARPLHFQSLLVIQPIDMMADGSINMCDGCPDMTVQDGELVWSCRLEERLNHGAFFTAAPKSKGNGKAKAQPKPAPAPAAKA